MSTVASVVNLVQSQVY